MFPWWPLHEFFGEGVLPSNLRQHTQWRYIKDFNHFHPEDDVPEIINTPSSVEVYLGRKCAGVYKNKHEENFEEFEDERKCAYVLYPY